LLAVGVVARLVLMHRRELVSVLSSRVEVTTPVTSFKRLNEGVFLMRNNIDAYEGGVVHQAPLLLALFHVLDERIAPYLFVLLDVVVARMLIEIQGKADILEDPTIPRDDPINPVLVGVAYLLNPLSIVTCLAKSTLLFNSAAVVAGVYFAVKGESVYSMFFLALATYLSVYPFMLVFPCGVLIASHSKSKVCCTPFPTTISSVIVFTVFFLALLGVSNLFTGSWNFLESTYGVILLVPDLQPNIGLWWYIFIEMFDQFRLFFLLVFQVFVIAFCVPITLKFIDHPLFTIATLSIITATFKSYPSVGDVALYIPFVFMHQELFKYMKNLYIVTHLGIATCILLPLFYNLWIYAGSGNANFFYAITLVVGVAQVLLLGDFMGAMVRREWERE
ncbi:GPI transamidase subunit PIG-U, partial [Chytriomyces sp. MP71]